MRPWKYARNHQNIYPEGNKNGKIYSGKYENQDHYWKSRQQSLRSKRIVQGY